MSFLEKTSWVLANISSSVALVISIFFWVFLYDGVNSFPNIFVHLLNSVRWCNLLTNIINNGFVDHTQQHTSLVRCSLFSVLLDLFIVSRPSRLLHFVHPLLFGVWYLIFSLVYWAVGGTDPEGHHWIYPMVDWEKPSRALGTAMGLFTGRNWESILPHEDPIRFLQ